MSIPCCEAIKNNWKNMNKCEMSHTKPSMFLRLGPEMPQPSPRILQTQAYEAGLYALLLGIKMRHFWGKLVTLH